MRIGKSSLLLCLRPLREQGYCRASREILYNHFIVHCRASREFTPISPVYLCAMRTALASAAVPLALPAFQHHQSGIAVQAEAGGVRLTWCWRLLTSTECCLPSNCRFSSYATAPAAAGGLASMCS